MRVDVLCDNVEKLNHNYDHWILKGTTVRPIRCRTLHRNQNISMAISRIAPISSLVQKLKVKSMSNTCIFTQSMLYNFYSRRWEENPNEFPMTEAHNRFSSHTILKSSSPGQMQKVNPTPKNRESSSGWLPARSTRTISDLFPSVSSLETLPPLHKLDACTERLPLHGAEGSWHKYYFLTEQTIRSDIGSITPVGFNRYNLQDGGVTNADKKLSWRSNLLSLSRSRLLEFAYHIGSCWRRKASSCRHVVVIPCELKSSGALGENGTSFCFADQLVADISSD